MSEHTKGIFIFKHTMFLSGILAALPITAQAWDFTPDPSRVLSDPSYLPSQWQLSGTTGFQFGQVKEGNYDSLGRQYRSVTDNDQFVNQSLAFGLTDDVTFTVSDSYVPTEQHNEDYGSDFTRSYHFQGFEDPSFGATWRMLDQKEFPVSIDLSGSYAPDLFRSKEATALGSTGSAARGGDEGNASLAVSYKTHSFTILGNGGATYYGSRTYYESDQAVNGTSHYWGYFGGIQTQTRFTDAFSLNAGYRYTVFNNETSAFNYDIVQGNENAFNAALNYQIIPNRLVAGLTYSYSIYGNSHDNYTNPAFDTMTRNEKENLFGARLQYTFF